MLTCKLVCMESYLCVTERHLLCNRNSISDVMTFLVSRCKVNICRTLSVLLPEMVVGFNVIVIVMIVIMACLPEATDSIFGCRIVTMALCICIVRDNHSISCVHLCHGSKFRCFDV